MTISVHHDGKNLDVEVRVDVDGRISFAVRDGDNRLSYEMPSMTPFEASMLARDLNRAANKIADTHMLARVNPAPDAAVPIAPDPYRVFTVDANGVRLKD